MGSEMCIRDSGQIVHWLQSEGESRCRNASSGDAGKRADASAVQVPGRSIPINRKEIRITAPLPRIVTPGPKGLLIRYWPG